MAKNTRELAKEIIETLITPRDSEERKALEQANEEWRKGNSSDGKVWCELVIKGMIDEFIDQHY